MESKPDIEPVQEVIEEVIPTIEPLIEILVEEPIEEVIPVVEPIIEPTVSKIETVQPVESDKSKTIQKDIITEGVTPLIDVGGGYVQYNNGVYSVNALKEINPSLFAIRADTVAQSSTNFGIQFPKIGKKGDIFVRVDVLPNRVFKFDGKKWLEQNKSLSQSYLYNQDYIEFLIDKINSGEYDIDVLSDNEKAEIESYLKK